MLWRYDILIIHTQLNIINLLKNGCSIKENQFPLTTIVWVDSQENMWQSEGSMRQEMSQTDNPGQNTGNVWHQITLPRETRCHIHTSHASLLLWAQESVTFTSKYLNVFSLLFCSDFPKMHFLCLQCSNLLRASGESHCPESQSALSLLASDWSIL